MEIKNTGVLRDELGHDDEDTKHIYSQTEAEAVFTLARCSARQITLQLVFVGVEGRSTPSAPSHSRPPLSSSLHPSFLCTKHIAPSSLSIYLLPFLPSSLHCLTTQPAFFHPPLYPPDSLHYLHLHHHHKPFLASPIPR